MYLLRMCLKTFSTQTFNISILLNSHPSQTLTDSPRSASPSLTPSQRKSVNTIVEPFSFPLPFPDLWLEKFELICLCPNFNNVSSHRLILLFLVDLIPVIPQSKNNNIHISSLLWLLPQDYYEGYSLFYAMTYSLSSRILGRRFYSLLQNNERLTIARHLRSWYTLNILMGKLQGYHLTNSYWLQLKQ